MPISRIVKDGYRLIYAHPEAFLKSPLGMALIRDPTFEQRVCCIAIDEAHMIAEWQVVFICVSNHRSLPTSSLLILKYCEHRNIPAVHIHILLSTKICK